MSSQPDTGEGIAILGAGAWGTALAVTLARRGRNVTLCVRRAAQLEAMLARRENAAYLPGIELPDNLRMTDRWREAVARCRVVVMAVPSRHARAAVTPVASAIGPGATIVSVAKGIEDGTLLTMSAMLAEIAPAGTNLAALSGPGFAAEVARGKPAAIVAASRDEEVARRVQELFAGHSLRVYSSTDLTGVEICAAVKNVIAIAAGTSDGLELGSSARAAVITRGLAEVMRLVEAAGGRRETAAGLSGLGDLVLTCTGDLSRNRAVGLKLAAGVRPRLEGGEPVDEEGRQVAEGVASARSVHALAGRLRVDMPIVAAVYRALYEGEAPNAMVDELLSRGLKAEF
jgi:glycerol-3-phosphate dehydrogenase (NAD(P)+)